VPRKKRRGRPARAGKVATERIELRVTKLERAAWEHAAAQAGISVSEWIRRMCSGTIAQDGEL
jgi:predicted HicB family RNase H-like nuclease